MPSRDNEAEFIDYCVRGNANAKAFVTSLFQISQTLDDLVDRDNEVEDHEIFKAFHACLVGIPLNPFYARYSDYFVPILSQYLMDWYDATQIERLNDDHLKNVAFGLRSNLGSILEQCAFIVGGIDFQLEVSVKVKEHIWLETLEEYKQEF